MLPSPLALFHTAHLRDFASRFLFCVVSLTFLFFLFFLFSSSDRSSSLSLCTSLSHAFHPSRSATLCWSRPPLTLCHSLPPVSLCPFFRFFFFVYFKALVAECRAKFSASRIALLECPSPSTDLFFTSFRFLRLVFPLILLVLFAPLSLSFSPRCPVFLFLLVCLPLTSAALFRALSPCFALGIGDPRLTSLSYVLLSCFLSLLMYVAFSRSFACTPCLLAF